ncbi:hypothetical protein D3OALGA1CA_2189 [Olavius algarvensis associated proteobacterium Delta 3]|nr:hypothetical protein D3OALGA1CA_2189 [Olavius algarvensis associated proteobacterium Delta 3]CAB5160057.1 hypothetical protein D3OALGB2SA_5363 [Olavius algarvensis associated proteobacterium Delta 3]
MSVMKHMMNGMMPVMMKGVSSEEKQEMMLKMMPMMMADIDMAEMMPKMMAAMLPELLTMKSEFTSQDDAGEKMLDRMANVMPNMCELIDKKALAEKKDAMISKLMDREVFRERMPKCFAKGMPLMVRGFFEHFLPVLSKEKRQEFVSTVISMVLEYGARDFSDEEKRALVSNS